ncbi:MAG TPA: FkbM family methyltransferase [Solirubrobacteraceae bacterium]|nr:FkbM family methyltransferase [Solirubrobacteraceae bacterium]
MLLRRMLDNVRARLIGARLVRESGAFFWGELRRPPGVSAYTIRRSGVRVAIRHRSVDAATLIEVFGADWYATPPEVARALSSPRQIVDLGANIGLFGAFAASRWPQAAILAYEPEPGNAAVHERTIAENGAADRWTLVRAAAGTGDGTARFASGQGPSSHIVAGDAAPAEQVIDVALRDVLPVICGADLVKIDVEGGEWQIIADARFAADPPRVVVLEYHPGQAPAGATRAEAERLLAGAGLRTAPIAGTERDGCGMLWGWLPGGA